MATWTLEPDTVHLNHGAFGACPAEVLAVQSEFRRQMEANPVGFMLRTYQPALERSRTALAGFVGADEAGTVFVPNATYGVNSALRTIEPHLPEGAELVVTSHTYAACWRAVDFTARRCGGSVVVVDVPFPVSSPDEVTAAFAAAVTERTAMVLLDHVTSPTAIVMPLGDIVSMLDDSVADSPIVVVDGAHAPGMIDVDIVGLGVDFYTANCHKWICSPKGAAFLWVGERWRDHAVSASISFAEYGWHTSGSTFHANFDWTGTDDPTARLSVAAAIETIGSHHPDGWDGIRSSNHALAMAGRQVLLDLWEQSEPVPESMIGSIAALQVPDRLANRADGRRLAVELQEQFSIELPVFAFPEPPSHLLRVSAQQYNSIADYEALATAMRTLDGS